MPDPYIFTGQYIKSIRIKKLVSYLKMSVSIERKQGKFMYLFYEATITKT